MTDWYPISAMRTAHVPVWLAGSGYEVIGEIRRHPGLSQPGKPVWYWWEIQRTGKARALAAVGVEGDYGPRLFRPLDLAAWPYGLPQPVSGTIPPPPQPSGLPPEPDDGTEGGDGWPRPGLRLGSLVAPETKQECEARLLRALRTVRSPAVDSAGNFSSSYAGDIPREMADIGKMFAKAERLMDAGEQAWESHEALPSPWQPTRRDITDWLYCLYWIGGIRFRDFLILEMRAASPVWTYRLIGEHKAIRLHPQLVYEAYKRTIEDVFRRARR